MPFRFNPLNIRYLGTHYLFLAHETKGLTFFRRSSGNAEWQIVIFGFQCDGLFRVRAPDIGSYRELPVRSAES